MRITIITVLVAGVLLASCGDREDGTPAPRKTPEAPISDAFAGASPTPLPRPGLIDGVDYDVPPDVARHVARQERCSHWREERAKPAPGPEVARGLTTDCAGIDAELDSLRRLHDAEPKAFDAMRRFQHVEG